MTGTADAYLVEPVPTPRTQAELEAKLAELKKLRSDGTLQLREQQEALDNAIVVIGMRLRGMKADKVHAWIGGGDDFGFDS